VNPVFHSVHSAVDIIEDFMGSYFPFVEETAKFGNVQFIEFQGDSMRVKLK